MSKTNIKNIDSVDLGNMEIVTTLNGGYDSNTPKEHKREITLKFTGFDKLDDASKETLLNELAGKLRIKVNQAPPSGELKGRIGVHDSESYAKMLDENDCEFTFDVSELYEPKELTPQHKMMKAADGMLDQGLISEEQHAEIHAEAKRQLEEAAE